MTTFTGKYFPMAIKEVHEVERGRKAQYEEPLVAVHQGTAMEEEEEMELEEEEEEERRGGGGGLWKMSSKTFRGRHSMRMPAPTSTITSWTTEEE